ncbi:MAG: NrfD/PsrC family molybdoenzyme membrane anchor subunit [Rhodospirillales bacterium]
MAEKTAQAAKDIDETIAWARINADVLRSMENPRKGYWVALAVCFAIFMVGVAAEVYQYDVGMGPSNLNNPHMWDLYISTFIFWIGMSHSGTLLSAILHIFHVDWRKPIYRFAEAMTTFSLLTALLFPVIHLGRVWNMHWVFPYLSDRGIWPNFRSPLVWDAFAIATYLTGSVLFLYTGMIPDLAICRDNATGWRKKLYTFLSVGWWGDDRQWRNFRKTYMIMACFLIPLAVSVHSIVAADFAMAIMPGWHVTSFPVYFVSGALYSGCAGIITLFVLLRYFFKFEQYMTIPILEKLCKLTFAIAMVWTYLNLIEFAAVWYGHDVPAKEVLIAKFTGPYSPFFISMLLIGMVLPFSLAFQKVRRNPPLLLAISLLLNTGMWMERYMILAPTLSLSFHPYTWGVMWPSFVEIGIVFGSFGLFGLFFFAFVKVFPSVSMYEVKEMVYHRRRVVFDEAEEKLHPATAPATASASSEDGT